MVDFQKEVKMNCENLRSAIDMGLNELKKTKFGSVEYKNGSEGLAKLIEAESRQTDSATKDFESGKMADLQEKKDEEELKLARARLDLDERIATKELEIKELQAQNETRNGVIKIVPAVGAGLVCLAEIGAQTYLEQTGHLWSPLRGLSNLANKIRL